MVAGITTCPDCGTALETQSQTKDLPCQALKQACPECEYTTEISILNYPNSYEAIGSALPDDVCERCTSDAMIRAQRLGKPVSAHCVDHMGSHRKTAVSLQSELN